MYARNMWEAAIEHREPILELCDDLERWNALKENTEVPGTTTSGPLLPS